MFGLIKDFEIKIDIFIKDAKFEYFPKLKKCLGEVEQNLNKQNWDFTDEFSNILGVIKVHQVSPRFHDFERIEKLIKMINYPDLFDVQDLYNNCFNWIQL